MRALVVEDDPGIASGLSQSLRQAGYAVDVCASVHSAWTALRVEPFDVMLLDLGLPDGDGLDLLARLRGHADRASQPDLLPRRDMPVLIMTARDGVSDRISGLDSGADDYIVKPFDPNEMLARLRAMLRRASGRSKPVIEHGDLVLDPATHSVERAGLPVPLGAKEFALLLTLLQARPQVLSKSRLESALYGFGDALESNAIEVHVHHLRRKLGESLIKTVRGVGYFVPQEPVPGDPGRA
ncbi:response regulator [Hydrogenophaga sp. SL48]|jgi:two-component system OmpR family response regulator/two-component system response regulator QseB|uniref:response regulator n=1 Tax=Hydrogenophaga sp. SL48 TaxID=2806347 RepID=UPI001F2BCC18|nr:response regulator transcription factor [Hydrogenophaga sp. SL48]UJW80078.1 response regulator transcription factor [Hydrogenophaga sp. SL48]